jgi:glycosyltransferase involved in cell wall biosynthesis
VTPGVARPAHLPVLHLLAPQAAGGLESVVAALAAAQRERGRAATVLALLDPWVAKHPFVDALENAGLPVKSVREARRRYDRDARAVAAIARDSTPAILHAHGYRADVVGYWASRLTNVCTVSTVHGYTGRTLRNRFYELVDRMVLRRYDATLAVSAPLARQLIRSGVPASRVHLVPNGFRSVPVLPRQEARAALGISTDSPVVGWVGRLSAEKGPDLFVDALTRSAFSAVQAVVIGDGPARPGIEGRVQARRLDGRVRFLGRLDAAGRFMKAFDVFVISSRTEGTPIALLEAMSADVPVVAYAVGGIPDVVDNASAWLASPGDPTALADAITDALEHPEEREKRAAVAHSILVSRFGADAWVDKVDQIYQLAAESHAEGGVPGSKT